MKTIVKLTTIAALGTLAVAGALTPASAASTATEAFVANVRPNVIFLDESSRMALDKSPSRAVHAFAYREAKQQTIAGNSLTAYVQTNTYGGEAVALGGTVIAPLAPVTDLAVLPLDVAAATTAGIGDVVTGRSVGLDTPLIVRPAATAPGTLGSQLLPSERNDLARLSAANGRNFDALYKATQLDGLRQLATLYRDYSINGDDPALRAMATRELPVVNQRIAELRRL